MTEIKTVPATEFKDAKGGGYTFPINPFTKGNGCLVVNAELLSHGNEIHHILIEFEQAADPKCAGVIFEIELNTEKLSTFRHGRGPLASCLGFFEHVDWATACDQHKGMLLRAAAPPEARFLKVHPLSSMTSIWFDRKA
jgi:hypothetical protein